MPKIDLTKRLVALTLPGMNDVSINKGIVYNNGSVEPLTLDIYYPAQAHSTKDHCAAVILVTGHADPVIEAAVGTRLKDTEQYIGWARLLAASGVAAITYANNNPAADIVSLLDFLDHNATELGIDMSQAGLWSCSANVPNALSLLLAKRPGIRCAAFLYGFMLDRPGKAVIADAAAKSGFAAPNKNRFVDDIPADVPLQIIRAGADKYPGINQSIDDFCDDALRCNLPVTLINLPQAPHSFDILDSSESTKLLIGKVLEFLVVHTRNQRI